jgi:hypothetical protein
MSFALPFFCTERSVEMINAQEVFVTTMNLMDEDSETGTYEGYPDEYKKKAWSILTLLLAELTPASGNATFVENEATLILADDRTALTILPYGLAAHLLMTEDQTRSAFFNARYDELKRKRPAIMSKIVDVYNQPEETKTEEETEEETNIVIDGGEF